MDLWIRTQDKKNLIQSTHIYIGRDKTDIYVIWGHILLGKYKSKKRALEVLDEIQDELIGANFMPIEKDEEVVLTCGSARIYEMPEE